MFWIEQLTAAVSRYTNERDVPAIVVVDQSRSPSAAAHLARLPRVTRVVSYEPDQAQFAALGHDHPSSLDRVCREEHSTSHVIVMDSDAIPVRADWLDRVQAVLAEADCCGAADRAKYGLTHPCLAVMPVSTARASNFSEGVVEVGLDTGRLVALRWAQAGLRVHILRGTRAFAGLKGELFLDGSLYHHGSGSFGGSDDVRLLARFDAWEDGFFRARAMSGQFDLRATTRRTIAAGRRALRLLRRVRSQLSRVR